MIKKDLTKEVFIVTVTNVSIPGIIILVLTIALIYLAVRRIIKKYK